ncbi:LADA_0D10506g1_1 [Lachancea dasiensis]|uniref:LADA_0D10506g1_1 n=1 Tax=Lachancea dasiensis TaxID=1072105 RepID=A0A1G4J7M2_9SACH|nr:LADA_0D10506g1_1 [Lachancea dasiensis]
MVFLWLYIWLCFSQLCLCARTVPKDTNDERFPFTTVVDLLWQNVEFSTFLRKVQKCGFVDYLNGIDNFTLFAPINSAYANHTDALKLHNYLLHDTVLDPMVFNWGRHIIMSNDSRLHLLEVKGDGSWLIDEVPVFTETLKPNMQNATLCSIAAQIPDSPLLSELLNREAYLCHFFKLVEVTSTLKDNSMFDRKTVIIPDNNAFEEIFDKFQLAYLITESQLPRSLPLMKTQKRDRWALLKSLMMNTTLGGRFETEVLLNLNGDPLLLQSHDNGSTIIANNSLATTSNVLYRTGVAHIFSNLDFLSNYLHFTAEKMLLGMGADHFIEEIYIRNLSYLIDGSYEKPLTLFLAIDSTKDSLGYSKSSLLYHFVDDGVNLTRDFSDDKQVRLYDSLFCSSNKRLGGQCQRLKIERVGHHDKTTHVINKKYRVKDQDPIQVANVTIFFLQDDILLPADLVSSIDPFSGCSTSLKFLRELNLLDLQPNGKGYTILLPCFNAWSQYDLNLEYLEHNVTALNIIMKNYILSDLIYTDSTESHVKTTNFHKENITVDIYRERPDYDHVALNLSTIRDPIILHKSSDLFFDQGVVHPLRNVYLPDTLVITLQNLLDITNSFDFKAYLESSESLRMVFERSQDYSLLVPTAQSLLLEEITLNSTKLEEFLRLHIIWSNTTQHLFHCSDEIETLHGAILNCRQSNANTHFLRVQGGADKEVRILKKGCSSSNNSSCVFLIDRPISLSWLDQDKYRIRLPGIAIAMGTLIGILVISGVFVCALLVFIRKQRVNETEVRVPESEQDRLLPSPRTKNQHHYSSSLGRSLASTEDRNVRVGANQNSALFASSYSAHTGRDPLSINPQGGHPC